MDGASDYYASINSESKTLKSDLSDLLFPRLNKLEYAQVWQALVRTDKNEACDGLTYCSKCDQEQIIDIYSTNCWMPEKDQCGSSISREGECYNREHSWPRSWWGGHDDVDTPDTDLHHLFPTDGMTNRIRSNHPYGIVDSNVSYTSSNGAKLGECSAESNYGWHGQCFEPSDAYKGDVARAYFYIAVAYANRLMSSRNPTPAVHGASLAKWQDALLRKWHHDDPVSAKEQARNDQVHLVQGNRNPFIDHSDWVERIDFTSGTIAPGMSQCLRGQRGPVCSANDDCSDKEGCLRCARSGFCTAEPLPPPPRPMCVRYQYGPSCSSHSDCSGIEGCVRCANSGFCTDVEI